MAARNSSTQETKASGMIHNPGISFHWFDAEQTLLETLIAKYSSIREPLFYFYAAIASHFRDKTTRCVALRHKWMMEKGISSCKLDSTVVCPDPGGIAPTFIPDAHDPVWTDFARKSEMLDAIEPNIQSLKPEANANLMSEFSGLIPLLDGELDGVAMQTMPMPPLPSVKEDLMDTILGFWSYQDESCVIQELGKEFAE